MPENKKGMPSKAGELIRELRDAADERTEVTAFPRNQLARVAMPESFLPAFRLLHNHLVRESKDGTPQLNTAALKRLSVALAGADEDAAQSIYDQLSRPWDDYLRFRDTFDGPKLPEGFVG